MIFASQDHMIQYFDKYLAVEVRLMGHEFIFVQQVLINFEQINPEKYFGQWIKISFL